MNTRRRVFVAMVIALGLSFVVQNYIFTASGEAVQPQVIEAVKNLPETISSFGQNLAFRKPSANNTGDNTPFLFPTGSDIQPTGYQPTTETIDPIKPQPTTYIPVYPTATPYVPVYPTATPYVPVYPTATSYIPPRPTNTPWPTARPQPTATPRPQPTATPQPTAYTGAITNMDQWGECLHSKGLIMYYITNCPRCSTIKNNLGAAFKHLESYNCNINNSTCGEAGVQGIPAFGMNGVIVASVNVTNDQLASATGCKLP